MKQVITKITCDVCIKEISKIHSESKTIFRVIMTTEQTEGRSVKPYFQLKELDICHDCEQKVLEGNMIFGSGAMGYNQYWFKDDKK